MISLKVKRLCIWSSKIQIQHYRWFATGWYWVYESGAILSKVNYVDDLIQGEKINWYEGGAVLSKINYVDDKAVGEAIQYYESGEVKYKVNYVDNLIQGEMIYYNKKGEIKEIMNYKNGRLMKIKTNYEKHIIYTRITDFFKLFWAIISIINSRNGYC